jgi:hypothetical protein
MTRVDAREPRTGEFPIFRAVRPVEWRLADSVVIEWHD